MASVAPATRPTSTHRRPAAFGLLTYVSALIIAGVIGTGITLVWGQVHGYQFSPDNFHIRQFWYLRIPLVRLQIVSTWFSPATCPTPISELNRLGYFPPPRSPLVWDTVEYRLAGQRTAGDAHYVHQYFDSSNSAVPYFDWVGWTKKHPQLSASFWNAVVTMARDGLYLPASDLLEFAQELPENLDAKATEQDLTERTLASYDRYARVWAELGDATRSQTCRRRMDEIRSQGWQRVVVPVVETEPEEEDLEDAASASESKTNDKTSHNDSRDSGDAWYNSDGKPQESTADSAAESQPSHDGQLANSAAPTPAMLRLLSAQVALP